MTIKTNIKFLIRTGFLSKLPILFILSFSYTFLHHHAMKSLIYNIQNDYRMCTISQYLVDHVR